MSLVKEKIYVKRSDSVLISGNIDESYEDHIDRVWQSYYNTKCSTGKKDIIFAVLYRFKFYTKDINTEETQLVSEERALQKVRDAFHGKIRNARRIPNIETDMELDTQFADNGKITVYPGRDKMKSAGNIQYIETIHQKWQLYYNANHAGKLQIASEVAEVFHHVGCHGSKEQPEIVKASFQRKIFHGKKNKCKKHSVMGVDPNMTMAMDEEAATDDTFDGEEVMDEATNEEESSDEEGTMDGDSPTIAAGLLGIDKEFLMMVLEDVSEETKTEPSSHSSKAVSKIVTDKAVSKAVTAKAVSKAKAVSSKAVSKVVVSHSSKAVSSKAVSKVDCPCG
jgi:hypothetical protein